MGRDVCAVCGVCIFAMNMGYLLSMRDSKRASERGENPIFHIEREFGLSRWDNSGTHVTIYTAKCENWMDCVYVVDHHKFVRYYVCLYIIYIYIYSIFPVDIIIVIIIQFVNKAA